MVDDPNVLPAREALGDDEVGEPARDHERGVEGEPVEREFRADGVRVLITGGTSGLGHAIAAALIDAGAHGAVTGRIRGAPGMPRRGSRRAATVGALGGIDVLVNNAGSACQLGRRLSSAGVSRTRGA